MSAEVCVLCPRRCSVPRSERAGFCRSGSVMRIARAAAHYWEEPPISGTRGSGAVFFTGCSLRCVYCQNHEISSAAEAPGRDVTPEELSGIFFELADSGVHNINLVTAGHFLPLVREALMIKKLPIPVVYNSSGYERPEALRTLEGLADIYLPDFKYAESTLAGRLSHAPDYPETAIAAIREMVRQAGAPVFDSDGLMRSGVLIRHLILPGHTKNSIAALELLHSEFPDIPVSLMAQYTPREDFTKAEREEFPELTRRITRRELIKVQNRMMELDMDGFVQSRSAGSGNYLPDFHQFG